ncbi:MAG: thioredoxin domain-containing protein, partial [Spirochaetes bacterium]|nr:thioredoxin domain-containing protein [Spirochaetota bacterium]
DIDEYFMTFIMAIKGSGGWPLNVILTPDQKPIYAFTYAPVKAKFGMPGILDILNEVLNFFKNSKDQITEFEFKSSFSDDIEEAFVLQNIGANFDWEYGGVGKNSKFIYASTLLFMIYYYEYNRDEYLSKMIRLSLDNIIKFGLHDHLQGGFFRYTTDRYWKIPHFEKMLYDQALLLWIFSLAFHQFNDENYKITALKIVKCLMENFKENHLFYTAVDADTDDEEGIYYLWSYDEIKTVLTEEEFNKFTEVYEIAENGNFNGKNHLVKKDIVFLNEIEEKLLNIRKKRNMPFLDKKIITSWNCLTGIGLINAYRFVKESVSAGFIKSFLDELLKKHYKDKILYHSSYNGVLNNNQFIEDYSSLLLFLTYYYEEFQEGKDLISDICKEIDKFKLNGNWVQSKSSDFIEIPINTFDNPVPSNFSMIETAFLRKKILFEEEYLPKKFKRSLQHDFYNVSVLINNGLFHVLESPEKIDWEILPINTIQLRGDEIKHCYKGECKIGKMPEKR